MPLAIGSSLGPYQTLAALGAGGMGDVYRANDTKLGRDVPLKILSSSFINDSESLARFPREAQILAALNHPHIGAIYGIDEATARSSSSSNSWTEKTSSGTSPAARCLRIEHSALPGRLPTLDAAHEKGVIHRDLKPANIALARDGVVKVLDFGLAKAIERPDGVPPDVDSLAPITSPELMTGVGVILGTAAYMSPEQARGLPVDRRSDIWSFGCVVYEMLTGRRLFATDTVTDTLPAVLTREPECERMPVRAPTAASVSGARP